MVSILDVGIMGDKEECPAQKAEYGSNPGIE